MNQEIIKLALAGGWIDKEANAGFARTPQRESQILLDKEFWIALAKGLGLGDGIICKSCRKGIVTWNNQLDCGCDKRKPIKPWHEMSHQFLDARFEGREQEFFKELIEKR